MGFGELLLLAIGVSMDAFAVSICKGLSVKKAGIREMSTCGVWFGGFQAFMPLTGFFLGALFHQAIAAFDHWVAFGLLGLLGVNMLKEAFSKEESCDCDSKNADFSLKTMFVMAIATSIDALAVGISLAMAGDVNIWIAISLIGITTAAFSAAGVKIGNIFGSLYEKKAEAAGGIILVLLGFKILLEHLPIAL